MNSGKTQRQLRNYFNRTGFQFLIVDLEAAATFVDRASQQTREPETRLRNLQNARKAYDTVLNLRPKFSLTSDQQRVFEERLLTLREALERLGEDFDT